LVLETAWEDFERLLDFLAPKSPSATRRARDALVRAITSLDEFAERGRPTGNAGVRELIVPFGSAAYIVTYRIEADRVLVARLHHSREGR
ncbi:MAG: type II toxin-antitoxin system RelE/ParE family toxin, partial [Caulobacteraceae bacterium]